MKCVLKKNQPIPFKNLKSRCSMKTKLLQFISTRYTNIWMPNIRYTVALELTDFSLHIKTYFNGKKHSKKNSTYQTNFYTRWRTDGLDLGITRVYIPLVCWTPCTWEMSPHLLECIRSVWLDNSSKTSRYIFK